MRATVAKRIRKLARLASGHLPDLKYSKQTYQEIKRKDRHGVEQVRYFVTGTMFMEECTRRTYKSFKKAYKELQKQPHKKIMP